MKAGDIIFLTRRAKKLPIHRWIVSNGIAVATRRKGQNKDDVKVHAAIIYEWDGKLKVREMESTGSISISLSEYSEMYSDRMKVVEMAISQSEAVMQNFNKACHSLKVKYDYTNTFIWQLTRSLFKKWLGKNTPYRRMCAEDVQRMRNCIDFQFSTVEKTNPNELWYMVK